MRIKINILAVASVLLALSFPLAMYCFSPEAHKLAARICGPPLTLTWEIGIAMIYGLPLIAILTGHTARRLIHRNGQRLVGPGFAVAGLCFGYVGLAWVVFAPTLLVNRGASREAHAVGSLRVLSLAIGSYGEAHRGQSLPSTLGELAQWANSVHVAKPIDKSLANGSNCMYQFTYVPGMGKDGQQRYQLFADPINTESARHLFVDQSGAFRAEYYKRASEKSPLL